MDATQQLAVPLVQAGKVDVSIHAQIDLLKGKNPKNLFHSPI